MEKMENSNESEEEKGKNRKGKYHLKCYFCANIQKEGRNHSEKKS